ncbi:GNAT family N-acetyltransferase [Desulfospira joergensenii]|uniref:GNAT family N-acetyltransferase n=1 Tax=Desulfospira joergensenii TaxID=53329 RepID=UPI0003B48AC3|nr:GNAT family N-acetyltransferase [Desulfospira joergensenii]
MNISEVQPADLEPLSRLYQQLIPNDVSLEKMKKIFERNRDNKNHIVLAAKEQGTLVGSLLASITEMFFGQCRSFMVIEDFVVDESRRGKGIGKALMKEAERIAAQRDVSYIMLITDSIREDSCRFYHGIGYQSEGYCAFKKHLG